LTNDWPWDRALWTKLTQRLLNAGARLVAYDFVFNGQTSGDKEFGEVITRNSDKVIIGARMGSVVPGGYQIIAEPEPSLVPAHPSETVGLLNLAPDESDNLVRSLQNDRNLVPLYTSEWAHNPISLRGMHKTDEYSLAWLAAKKFLGLSPDYEANARMPLNYYGPAETINIIPLEDALRKWDTTYQHGAYFKGKAVFVGPWAEMRFSDYFNTPLDYMSGVEIQATAFANLVHGEWLRPPSDLTVLLLAIGLGLMALAVSLGVQQVLLKIGLFLSLGVIFLVATQHLFWSDLLVTPVAGAALILICCGTFGTIYDFMLAQYERQRVLGIFESMVSPAVAGLLVNERGEFEKRLGGQRQEVVVLFCDIRGFTKWSEKVGPDMLVAQWNEYLTEMVEIIQNEDGTVQKYLGDALMAAWGDVRAQPATESSRHAVRTGLRMRDALQKLNAAWLVQPGREQLAFGIGINHGHGLVGRIGHPRRQEFTVMGDPVNLAARLESATKQYRQVILVGESIYEMTRDQFYYRLVDKALLQGVSSPVLIYTPLTSQENSPPPGLGDYDTALKKYYARDFAGAAELLRSAQAQMGGRDFLCENFLLRCEYYGKNAPPQDWEGTWILKDK
jgi:adenylate cyclase